MLLIHGVEAGHDLKQIEDGVLDKFFTTQRELVAQGDKTKIRELEAGGGGRRKSLQREGRRAEEEEGGEGDSGGLTGAEEEGGGGVAKESGRR
jgi:hypothetical protein